jgi:hypothetical protein
MLVQVTRVRVVIVSELGLNCPPPPEIVIIAVAIGLHPGEALGLALGVGEALGVEDGFGLEVGDGLGPPVTVMEAVTPLRVSMIWNVPE